MRATLGGGRREGDTIFASGVSAQEGQADGAEISP